MKKRYSEEQILSEASKGGIAGICRRYGFSDAIYYNSKKKYDGMTPSDLRKLEILEEDNRKLSKIVADKELDIDALKSLLVKYDDANRKVYGA